MGAYCNQTQWNWDPVYVNYFSTESSPLLLSKKDRSYAASCCPRWSLRNRYWSRRWDRRFYVNKPWLLRNNHSGPRLANTIIEIKFRVNWAIETKITVLYFFYLYLRFQRQELKLRDDQPLRRSALAKIRGRFPKYREAQILHMIKQTDETCGINIMLPDAIINVRVYCPYPAKTQVRKSWKQWFNSVDLEKWQNGNILEFCDF